MGQVEPPIGLYLPPWNLNFKTEIEQFPGFSSTLGHPQGRRKVVKREEARTASAEDAEWGGVWGGVSPPQPTRGSGGA